MESLENDSKPQDACSENPNVNGVEGFLVVDEDSAGIDTKEADANSSDLLSLRSWRALDLLIYLTKKDPEGPGPFEYRCAHNCIAPFCPDTLRILVAHIEGMPLRRPCRVADVLMGVR